MSILKINITDSTIIGHAGHIGIGPANTPRVSHEDIAHYTRAHINHVKKPDLNNSFNRWKRSIFPRAFIDSEYNIWYKHLVTPTGKAVNHAAMYPTMN
jgi:hypothetical protein